MLRHVYILLPASPFSSRVLHSIHSGILYTLSSNLSQLICFILSQILYFPYLREHRLYISQFLTFSIFDMEFHLPQPELLRESYTVERVQEGIAYADQRMRSPNPPSPNVTKLLATYKSACQDFLIRSGSETGFEEWSRTALLKEIRTYEERMAELFWFTKIDDEETQSFQANLLKLRRYQYYARYGDYARKLASELGITPCEAKAEDWELLSREYPWRILSDKLREEKPVWKKYRTSAKADRVQTTRHVRNACIVLGVDIVQMEQAIHTCGDLNEALCSSVGTFLEKGEYSKLAEMISTDLNDLSSIFPLELKHEETLIRAILLELKDRWFEIEQEDHPYYPPASSWQPRRRLRHEHIIHEHPTTKEAAKAHHHKMVVGSARNHLRALKMVKDLVVGPRSGSGIQSSRRKNRRAIYYLRKRRDAWFAIAASARKYDSFNSSLAMQRIVNTVVSSLQDGIVGPSSPVLPRTQSPALTPATSLFSGDWWSRGLVGLVLGVVTST